MRPDRHVPGQCGGEMLATQRRDAPEWRQELVDDVVAQVGILVSGEAANDEIGCLFCQWVPVEEDPLVADAELARQLEAGDQLFLVFEPPRDLGDGQTLVALDDRGVVDHEQWGGDRRDELRDVFRRRRSRH